MANSAFVERLASLGVIPVLRLANLASARTAIDCLIEAGYETVELTLTTPGAVALITDLKRESGDRLLVGAGTVLDLPSAQACLDAGADYLVSPCRVEGMAAAATRCQRFALIGAFTPAEVLSAWREGAALVKVFPASSGGPKHLAALHAVFPEIPLCPTGGLGLDNMLDYFKAGARVVGVGNNVIDAQALQAGDRAQVIRRARRFLDLAGGAREAL
jgi:2-dehydro-3-deoxyphosphogluconate aldolase / (4S)-4-hydroxy-2-oxoglutarate aldolase